MVSKTITLFIRLVQAVFAVTLLGIGGHMISTSYWNQIPRQGGNAAEVNYIMFLGVWTLLSMLWFVTITFQKQEDSTIFEVTLVLDGICTLFYMCGAIALAAAMEIHSCSNLKYTKSNRITNSSPDTAWRCREAQAATSFVWFGFLAFVVSTTISAIALYHKTKPLDDPDDPNDPANETEEPDGGPMLAEVPRPPRFTDFMGGPPTGGPPLPDDDRDNGIHKTYHPRTGGPAVADA